MRIRQNTINNKSYCATIMAWEMNSFCIIIAVYEYNARNKVLIWKNDIFIASTYTSLKEKWILKKKKLYESRFTFFRFILLAYAIVNKKKRKKKLSTQRLLHSHMKSIFLSVKNRLNTIIIFTEKVNIMFTLKLEQTNIL